MFTCVANALFKFSILFAAFDPLKLPTTPLATFQALGDIDEKTFGEASRTNTAAVSYFDAIERKRAACSAALQQAKPPSIEQATLAAGMLLSSFGAMAIAGHRGVNVIERTRAERELASCEPGTYAIVIDCNTTDFPVLIWCCERVNAPPNGTKALALFDRIPCDTYELSLKKNEPVTIISATRDVGWWKASSGDAVGLV